MSSRSLRICPNCGAPFSKQFRASDRLLAPRPGELVDLAVRVPSLLEPRDDDTAETAEIRAWLRKQPRVAYLLTVVDDDPGPS